MSLANLGAAYQEALDLRGAAELRARMAEEQMREFQELLAQWFLDGNEGARTFLREVAKLHREEQATWRIESITLEVTSHD